MSADARTADELTLSDALATLEDEGFKAQFATRDAGRIQCLTCRGLNEPASVRLERIIRLEGTSDPSEEMAVVGLVCPACSARGTLALSFGPEASVEDAIAFRELDDRREPTG